MYRLLLTLAFSLAAVTSAYAAPETPSADTALKEYQKLLENYYFLDKQKAGHIECSVSFPTLQTYIDDARKKFGNKVTIEADLHDFSVTYDRTKGIYVHFPHIKASALPDLKPADQQQAENRGKWIEKSLKGVVIEALDPLVDMNFPTPEKRKNLSLTKNGNVTVVSFDNEKNAHVSDTYSGSTLKETYSSPTLNETLAFDYQSLNGKLAVTHSAMQDTEGSTKTTITHSISYQDLGSAFFPAQILKTISEDPQRFPPQHLEIDFKDCKTSDLSP